MKLRLCFFSAVLAFALSAFVYASHPWLGKTLSASQVRDRWGDEVFEETKFKNGDVKSRAKMAFSLLSSKKMLGLKAAEVRTRLGDFDGHYFSETYPTYLIQVANKAGEESWQIVFLIDKDRKTREVIVHKNCCD